MIVAALLGPALAEGIELAGAGSTLAAPLYEKWIGAFSSRSHQSVILHYAAVGSGEGVARFIAGRGRFGASDVPQSLGAGREDRTRRRSRYQSRPEWSCLHTISLV